MKNHRWPVKEISVSEDMKRKIVQCVIASDGENQLVVMPENRSVWLELIRLAKGEAVKKYQEINPGTDIKISTSARMWLKGFQVGYLGSRIGSCIGIDPRKQQGLDKQGQTSRSPNTVPQYN